VATASSVTYSFTVGTAAVAAQVNQNFTDLVTWINTNATHLDGSKPFTSVPSGPAVDPSSDNQLARKAYVDRKGSTCLSSARPASPVVGQVIFETDKNRVRIWNGTIWQLVSGSQGASLSNVGQVVLNGASDLITFSTENYDTDSFFAGSGSTITIPEAGTYSVTLRLTQTAGKDFVQGLGSYARLNAPGSNSYYFPHSTHLYDQISETYVIPFSAADTFNVTFVCRCGSASVTFDSNIVIRRIGD
jgi:hypothetical protein